jgi:hypothetical protein
MLGRASQRPFESDVERRRRLNERLRAEFIAGAEAEWNKRAGRPMTAEELERVLLRYPGDRDSTGRTQNVTGRISTAQAWRT